MAIPKREIEAAAEQVLHSLDLWRLPVDPLRIAAEEEILLKPGSYGGKFDARIEFYPGYNRFCIFYRDQHSTSGRIRFSIAHELGHFYLAEHQARLRSGNVHFSVTDFRSRDPHEQEADQFAAALLMPRELFVAKARSFRQSVCDLPDLVKLADELNTSVTSTALRYCSCEIEPCTLVFSESGIIRWTNASEDMRHLGMSYIERGRRFPRGSQSETLWNAPAQARREGRVSAEVWFDRPQREHAWEDAMVLGDSPFMLTLLTPDD